jgi:hypothetical protein
MSIDRRPIFGQMMQGVAAKVAKKMEPMTADVPLALKKAALARVPSRRRGNKVSGKDLHSKPQTHGRPIRLRPG